MTNSNFKTSIIIGDSWKATNTLIGSGARPPVVKVHNNLSQALALHNCLGDDSIIIVRMTGTEWAANRGRPANEAAISWCQVAEPAFQATPWAYFEIGPPLQTADQWYADFQIAAMNWMHARGYKAVTCTFGEGNPEVPSGGGDGWGVVWPVVQLAASYGYILGPQAYWVDSNMDPNDDWHMFRIYRAFRDYPGKFPAGTRIVFTETGIDLRNGYGWRKALGGNWPRYRAGLKLLSDEINRRPCPAGVQVLGGTVFAIHEVDNEWRDFNFLEYLPDLLADIVAEQSIIEVLPEPDPPIPEEPDIVKVRLIKPGCNMRSEAKKASDLLGFADAGSEFEVQLPSQNIYLYIPSLRCWIRENNTRRI